MTADIDQLTEHLPAAQAREVKRAYRKQAKDETAAFLWCFFLGVVGAHRFYLRQWTRGLLHIQVLLIAAIVLIAGILLNLPALLIAILVAPFILGALIWSFIDLAHIDDEVSERNLHLGERLVAAAMLADPTRERQAETQLEAAQRQPTPAVPDLTPIPSLDAQYTPERESPPPLDVGVQAMTGIAGLGIAGGYRAVAEPAQDATPPAAPPSEPPAAPYAEPTTDPYAAPASNSYTRPEPELYIPPVAPAWDGSTQPATPAWDTPTPPPSYSRTPDAAPAPTRDLTDLGGNLGNVAPVADVDLNGPWQITPNVPAETGAEDIGLLVLEPEPDPEPAYAPPVWPAAPSWPAPAEPPTWPTPADAEPYAPPAAAPAETGGITQDMLADAAGLAGAGGIGAMGILASENAPTPAPTPEPTPQHLLRHIRVVRQVKVGDHIEETVAEAYIDPNEDPEPVRERLREQLRREAEAKQSANG